VKTIWIDLDNSPHVPFFAPIIEELESRGYSVLVTARDCFQVSRLADIFHLNYKLIGRHYGKHFLLKGLGLCIRAAELMPLAIQHRPSLAISHGSRSQLVSARVLGIPTVIIGDYEFAKLFAGIRPHWLIVPDVIPYDAVKNFKTRVLTYTGIKEEVYAPRFKPESSILQKLGLSEDDMVVTVRPPATEAHYHVHESEELFDEVIDYLGEHPEAKTVLLPRNQNQEHAIRNARPDWFKTGQVIVPDTLDGMNLIWHSDLVISGGGTMNREAAALGVPVYSIFRGKIGAVDRHLAATGKLTLIETRDQVRSKLLLKRRYRNKERAEGTNATLESIIQHICRIAEEEC
jgi:predicted glycosyltransferase